MSFPILEKDPDSDIWFPFNWVDRMSSGDSVNTSVWTIPSGLTKTDESIASPLTNVKLKGGGDIGTEYEINNLIVTTLGETLDWTIIIVIVENATNN